MSLTCLITSAAAASNHSEIVSSDSKYLLPFKIFLYLQSGAEGGGWESFTIRHSAIFTVFNKTGNFKRMLGSHLMAPEGLSLETFGTRAKGKFVLLLLDCALPQVNQCCFFCCSQDLLFLQTQNICFPWGEKNNKKKQLKKSPVCTEMAEITCNCHNLRGKKISSYLTCRVNLKKMRAGWKMTCWKEVLKTLLVSKYRFIWPPCSTLTSYMPFGFGRYWKGCKWSGYEFMADIFGLDFSATWLFSTQQNGTCSPH